MRPKRSAKPKLGRLEKIDPLDYWQSQADFQHWLIEPENLELLNEALGLELAIADSAALADQIDQGLNYLQLMAEGDTPALVTVQLGTADSAHLGELITWAAAESAALIIWIAADFHGDQRLALGWLNQLGVDQASFLGVEVELWQIGKNAMAVNFIPVDEAESEAGEDLLPKVSAPEPEPEPEPEPLTAVQQENLAFWSGLCDRLDRQGSLVKAGAPTPEATMGFAIARAGFRLHTILDRDHHSLYTELLLSGIDAHPHFYLLAHEKELIADETDLPLIWDDAGENTCVIASVLGGADIGDRDRWPEYQAWFCLCLERFYEAFFDRIKQLDAAAYQPLPRRSAPLTDALILPASQRG
jgi:hypothetical protein